MNAIPHMIADPMARLKKAIGIEEYLIKTPD